MRESGSTDHLQLCDVAFNKAGELYDSAGVLEASFATRHAFETRDRARYERRAGRLPAGLPVIGGRHLWITDRLSHFYYHWFADALPRLELALADPGLPRKLLLPLRVFAEPFVRKSLEAWPEVEASAAEGVDGDGRVEELVVTPRAAETPEVNAPAMRLVAGRLVARFADGRRAEQGERIYVTRHSARIRRVVNEAELLPVLECHGVRVVEMEALSLAGQIRLMRRVGTLVGPHGGGLTNMMFMQDGGVVAELRLQEGPPPCYRNLAAALGHRWLGLPAADASEGVHPHAADIRVDPQALDRLLGGLSDG